jgi:type IV secretion system protein VirB4
MTTMMATDMSVRAVRGLPASDAITGLLGKAILRSERFGKHIPYVSAVRDDIILNKQGDLMASITIDGIDSYTSEEAAVDEASESFARAVGQLGEKFGFYVNKVSTPETVDLASTDDDDFSSAVDKRWQSSLSKRTLKRRVIMLTLLLRPNIGDSLPWLMGRARRSFNDDIDRRVVELEEAMGLIEGIYQSNGLRRLNVSGGEWLSLLAATLGHNYKRIIAQPGQMLSEVMTNFDVTFRGRTMVLDDGMKERYGAIFGFKTYPAKTMPDMLDALQLPYDITITNSFTPRRTNEALEKMSRLYRQKGASEDQAVSLTEELPRAIDDVASGRAVYGDHNISIQVFTDTEAELEKAAAEIWRAGQDTGAVVVRERFAAKPTYFSQAPGNWPYRFRHAMISAQHFADLCAFHSTSRGRPHIDSPWGTNISAFPTITSGLHRFNFHEKGNRAEEPSVGHTLVLGRTGSGKTICTAFLIAQARRANARTIVFDKDAGLEMAVRALGGSYSEIKVGQPTGFNPFATETDARGAAWLNDWLNDVLSRNKGLDTVQSVALNEAVRQISRADEALRNFAGFESLVASTDDDGDLVSRVREWTSDGRYGWLFSRQAEQNISIGEDVLGIDMTELLDLNAERSALLAYLFRRIERVIEDRRPTIIVIDEAWKMLADDMFVKRLHDWLVTMRKRNCVVVMLTQTPGDLEDSPVGQIIAESVTTQFLFPNARANPKDYKILRLNNREADFLASSTGGQRLALLRSGPDSLYINTDLSGLGGLVTVLGGGKTGDEKAPYGWRQNSEFWKEMQ